MHVTKDSSTHYPDYLECLCVVFERGACAWCLFVRGACVCVCGGGGGGLRGVCVRGVCLRDVCVCGVCVFVCVSVVGGGSGLRGVCVVCACMCALGGGVCVYMLGVCVKLRPRTPELTGLQIYKKRHFQFNKNKQNKCHIE